jgi:exopolysaccharide biosynthesis WecB/TagA/CpsF family protein
MAHCATFGFAEDWAVEVNVPTRARLMEAVENKLRAGQSFSVATLNLDHMVKLRSSTAFRRAYAAQTFVVADGNPIVWLSHLARRPVALAPGSELVEPLAETAARLGLPVALVGSTEAVLARAAARLEARWPGLEIVSRIAPGRGFDPEGEEADACIESLRRSGARLVFLALGAPRQEIFATRAQAALPGCGLVSIGAGLDFLAGAQRRAPVWMRRVALEWLWRMANEPRRLTLRYWRCALILPGLALDALRQRGEPDVEEELQRV